MIIERERVSKKPEYRAYLESFLRDYREYLESFLRDYREYFDEVKLDYKVRVKSENVPRVS